MPGFNTLGARLARSRRRLERERAEVTLELLVQDRRDGAVQDDGAAAASAPGSAQVIRFPRLGERIKD